jgi:hypothetical protein
MSRYKILKKVENKKGIKKLETAYYNDHINDGSDTIVLTQEGDRFDLLANQFYGNPNLWWYIARANNMKFNALPAGIKLTIPASFNDAYAVESKDLTYLEGNDDTSPTGDNSGDSGTY